MGNCVTDWVFRRQRFCCCLPARLGAALLALLTLLLSGLLMVILWFEVATNYFMSGKEKAAFIVAGLLETFLFLASVLGFIGTLARKQSFVVIFVSFLYVHFLINLGVAIYFLWMVTHAANQDIVKLCQEGIRNQQTQDQCKGLLNITKGVYWGISLLVLAVEAYCTIVVTRYANQVRYEKREGRESRIKQRQSAYDAFHARFSSVDGVSPMHNKHYSALSRASSDLENDKEGLLNAPQVTPFDPYAAYDAHPRAHSPSTTVTHEQTESSVDEHSVARHRQQAERQLTSLSENAEEESQQQERRPSRSVSPLPPGAAPAVAPAIPHSPPPSYE
ncbi:uncharacterized protein FOMMEDRAFT_140590 [Fomitiporia mediterranea MF3/22]|uniref:uncharacterized protein n=1 Tax=Fomitiporia mediterranea (strain MF3/22) TaxID=694068 RepID=UPI0004408F36|nr:uncharacterized protein FOMMEDRAFT_140590 [Fomitiporia mediterranea MF3/22]EJD02687.1 hypothetical protein FOMMEDRAFT_140590 [Fomitiporia mediterranea MF3/22]